MRYAEMPVTQRLLTLRNIHKDLKPQGSTIYYILTVWLWLWVQNREFQNGASWCVFRLIVSSKDTPLSDGLVAGYFQMFLHPLCRFHCRWKGWVLSHVNLKWHGIHTKFLMTMDHSTYWRWHTRTRKRRTPKPVNTKAVVCHSWSERIYIFLLLVFSDRSALVLSLLELIIERSSQ